MVLPETAHSAGDGHVGARRGRAEHLEAAWHRAPRVLVEAVRRVARGLAVHRGRLSVADVVECPAGAVAQRGRAVGDRLLPFLGARVAVVGLREINFRSRLPRFPRSQRRAEQVAYAAYGPLGADGGGHFPSVGRAPLAFVAGVAGGSEST